MADALPKKLFKTTVVIWTDSDPRKDESDRALSNLAEAAESGDGYCSKMKCEQVDPRTDPDWDGTEFFGVDED